MKVEKFEELLVWQKARILVKDIYLTFGNLRDFSFKDQIARATVSVMNNIAEGFERKTNQEFIYFLYVAKGSSGEVRSMLYAALDLHYVNFAVHDKLGKQCEEISKMISGLIKTL